MQRSLCLLTFAVVLASCLLVMSVQSAPVEDSAEVRHRTIPSLDAYLTLEALMMPSVPERKTSAQFYEDLLQDMVTERSRRSRPVETFEPVSFRVLRRLLKNRQAEQAAETTLDRVASNNDIFDKIGRR